MAAVSTKRQLDILCILMGTPTISNKVFLVFKTNQPKSNQAFKFYHPFRDIQKTKEHGNIRRMQSAKASLCETLKDYLPSTKKNHKSQFQKFQISSFVKWQRECSLHQGLTQQSS